MANNTVNTTNNSELVSYDVVAMNGKEAGTSLKLYNSALIAHTQKLQKFNEAGRLSVLGIARTLADIQEDESYKEAGFKSVADYAYELFDYKRPTTSLYIKVGRAFLSWEKDSNKPAMNANLPTMSVGQMIELLPLVKNDTDITDVMVAIQNGTVNNRMSTKAIRNAVRSVNAIDGEVTSEKPAKAEKSDMEKAAKLGEFDADKLPKGMTAADYASAMIDAVAESLDNFAKALGAVEHNATVDTKLKSVMNEVMEIRAEINK